MPERWKADGVGVDAFAPPTSLRVRPMCTEGLSQSGTPGNSGGPNPRTPNDIRPPPPVAKSTTTTDMHPERNADAGADDDANGNTDSAYWPRRVSCRGRQGHLSRRTFAFEQPKPATPVDRIVQRAQQQQQPPPQQPRVRIGRNGEKEFPHLPPPQAQSQSQSRMNKDGKVQTTNRNRNRNHNHNYRPPPQLLPPVTAPSPAALGLKLVREPIRYGFNPFGPPNEPSAGSSNDRSASNANANAGSQFVRLPMTFDRAPAHLRRLLAATNEVQARLSGEVAPTPPPPQFVPASQTVQAPQTAGTAGTTQAPDAASRTASAQETRSSFNTGSGTSGSNGTGTRRVFRARRTRNAQRRNAYDLLRAPYPAPDRTPTPPSVSPPRPIRQFDLSNSGDIKDLIQALEAIDTMSDHLDQLEGTVNSLICRANLRSAQNDS